MKLPNAHLAIVEEEKIVGYLLNLAHRYGATKARTGKPSPVHSANMVSNSK